MPFEEPPMAPWPETVDMTPVALASPSSMVELLLTMAIPFGAVRVSFVSAPGTVPR